MCVREMAAALRRGGLMACVAVLGGLCGVSVAQDLRLNRELATDRFGGDFRALVLPSDAQCHDACADDPQCRAYTYALPSAPRGAGMCWLKNRPTEPSDAAGYVSGAKGAVGDLTVVVANLRGASPMEVGGGLIPPTVGFQERMRRLADQIADAGPAPDLILLTEVAGWANCGGAGDYDQLDHLLAGLRNRFGITWRIAFLVGTWTSYGWFGQCSVFWSQAVLYNPARLANRTPEDASLAFAHDSGAQGRHVRRSLPPCHRGSSLTPIESLLDGPPQTDRCGRPTPSGPAWTLFGALRASAGRFSLRHDMRASFDVIVVHPRAGAATAEAQQIADFIRDVQSPPFRTRRVALPAIVAGDFNELARSGWPPFAAQVFAPDADVMQLSLAAAPVLPPARTLIADPRGHAMLPAGTAECSPFSPGAFSDHCALLVRLAEIQPPPVLSPPVLRPLRPDRVFPRPRDVEAPDIDVCRRLPDLAQCQR